MPKIEKLSNPIQYNFKNRIIDNNNIYTSKRWRLLRLQVLKENPLCIECINEGKPLHYCIGNVIDHIKPINQGGKIYDKNNLQVLCSRHHNIKSARESREAGGGTNP